MSARRFFVERVCASGETIDIVGSDAHKIANVLRLRSGDTIEIADSCAQAFVATLEIERDAVRARLGLSIKAAASVAPCIAVAQGLPKGQKMDFVVEKLTELGVERILPFVCERAIAREVGASKVERWRRLAKTAALQCGRTSAPNITPTLDFPQLVASFTDYDRVLFAWEVAPTCALRDALPKALEGVGRLLVVIGPEGGFSHAEAESAVAAGARLISLGPRILRTETAALVLLAAVNYVADC